MIYGKRVFAFDKHDANITESFESTNNTAVTFESLVNGYDAVVALAEATDNNGLITSFDSLLEETILNEAKDETRKAIVKASQKAIRDLLTENGFLKCQVGGFYIGGECAKFMKGEGNVYLFAIKLTKVKRSSSYDWGSGNSTTGTESEDLTPEVAKWITNNKDKVIKAIKEATKVQKVSVNSVKIQEGRLGVINVAVEYKI